MAASVPASTLDDLLPESIDRLCRNPLSCHLCTQVYDDPCLLTCFHSFCSKCIRGHVLDDGVTCPVCSKVTVLKDGMNIPPGDVLMRYLVEFSSETGTPCANCEAVTSLSMFFCKTCGQALCKRCKEDTHRARMFSAHDVVPLSERLRKTVKQCPVHSEPFIMFHAEQKQMLCIKCFRQSPADCKMHCIDLDAAYLDSVRRLERTVLSIRELQNSVRDGIILYRALLDEVHHNMEAERLSVVTFCRQLHETVAQLQQRLIADLEGQYNTKNATFQRQLCDLCSLLPVLRSHLTMCTTFTHSANRTEFLELSYSLMKRLAEIASIGVALRPSESSQVKTSYRRELSHALEPMLAPPSAVTPDVAPQTTGSRRGSDGALRLLVLSETGGPFSELCRDIENRLQLVATRYRQLRELSPHRAERACQIVESELSVLARDVEQTRNRLHYRWDEAHNRLQVERDVFSSQMVDLQQLSSDLARFSAAVVQQCGSRSDDHRDFTDKFKRPEAPIRSESLHHCSADMCGPPFSNNLSSTAAIVHTNSESRTLLATVQQHGEELLRALRRSRPRSLQRWRVRSEERWPANTSHHQLAAPAKLTWSGRGDGPPVTVTSMPATAADDPLSWHSSASWPRQRRRRRQKQQQQQQGDGQRQAKGRNRSATSSSVERTAADCVFSSDEEPRVAESTGAHRRSRGRRASIGAGSGSTSKTHSGRRLKSADSCRNLRPQQPQQQQLRRADSFEGHEQTVRSLVAAVQESRCHQHARG